MSKEVRATIKALKLVPWKEVQELLDAMINDGVPDKDAVDAVVDLLDELMPAHLLPAPFGTVAELLDGPLARAALNIALRIAKKKAEKAQP